MAIVRTSFGAKERGFRFDNGFSFSLLLRLPLVGRIFREPIFYGLCGGFCYAALDYYYARMPVPSPPVGPKSGSRLHRYLWRRQLDSLARPSVLPRVIVWMLRRDRHVKQVSAATEFPKLRSRLDRMIPAVLLFIRVRGIADPTQNHQVIATGYDLDEVAERATIFLYDPNYPGQEPTLTLKLGGTDKEIELTQSTGECLRGFFVLGYRRRKHGLPGNEEELSIS